MLSKYEIQRFLSENSIYQYDIKSNNTVDVFENVNIVTKQECCPVKFGTISGDFNIQNCNLTSLKNMPENVKGHFNCRSNNLNSLEGSPKFVGTNYYCSHSCLKTLKGIPEYINGILDVSENLLENFKYAPKSVSKIIRAEKNNFISLEGIPYTTHSYINLNFNPINKLNLKDIEHLENDLILCFCDKKGILIEHFESFYSHHQDLEISILKIKKILQYHNMTNNLSIKNKKNISKI